MRYGWVVSAVISASAVTAIYERDRITSLGPRLVNWSHSISTGSLKDGKIRYPFGGPRVMERPWGMAPEPFRAYIRACTNAGVHPWRISQTIGEAPRSAGYHKLDGTIEENGRLYEYSAAVDMAALDLSDRRREIFMEALAKQGFASFWRAGPGWKNSEHIHAIYCLIPMKPQLRQQVLNWLDKRRAEGKRRPRWVRKLRRSPQFKRYLT
jgi:hypothetical protein